jgi:uncharacterized membrane protein YbjE (DUF340 family)
MTRTGKAALTTAILGSALTITDAVYGGVTSRDTIWDDATGQRWAIMAVGALIVALYALLAAVLVQKADRIDDKNGAVRWIRRTLLADLVVLIGVFIPSLIMNRFSGPGEAVAGVAFILMFLLGAALGVVLLRRPGMRTSAVLLLCPIGLIPLAMLADTIAPAWANPGYAEAALYIGLALLAHGSDRPVPRVDQPTPTPARG